MRIAITARLLLVLAFGILTPAPSWADALFSPWIGVVNGTKPVDGSRAFGWTVAGMRGGVVGIEVDFGFSPGFFDTPADSSALTAMGNLIVGIPLGGARGAGVRPYVTGGVGLMRTQIDTPSGRDNASNDMGLNVGWGLMGFFGDHFGVRGDLRYFQNLSEEGPGSLGSFDFDRGSMDFWRVSFGVVIR